MSGAYLGKCPETIQGIAALVNRGMVAAEQIDELVTDAIAYFLRGSRGAT